jgi:hypothetical protein
LNEILWPEDGDFSPTIRQGREAAHRLAKKYESLRPVLAKRMPSLFPKDDDFDEELPDSPTPAK